MLSLRLAANSTDDVAGQTYIAYVRSASNLLYLDFDDDTFKAFGDLVSGALDYVEDTDHRGLWHLSATLPETYSGETDIITRDSLADVFHKIQHVYVVSGEPLQDLGRVQVPVSTDTGGYNSLRVLDTDGEPIDGATVRLFKKLDFDAGSLDKVIGITSTDSEGRWIAPIYVNSGYVYTVLVQKDHVAGPLTVDVSV